MLGHKFGGQSEAAELELLHAGDASDQAERKRHSGGASRVRIGRTSSGDPKGERGATIVEFSLVLPIILLFIFGITELGLGFKDFLSVSNASREGTRIASSAGNDPNADCAVLSGLSNSLVALDLDQIDRVEVYRGKPDGSGQDLTKTNVYRYLAGDPMDCGNWSQTVAWPSTDRNTIVGSGPLSQPLTIVGVKVVYEHDWITGFGPFNGTWTFERSTQSRVEPEAFES